MAVKSHRLQFGKDFPVGEEWDALSRRHAKDNGRLRLTALLFAGVTPPGYHRKGKWTVVREPNQFTVVFFSLGRGKDYILESFPDTEQGEIEAKEYALSLVDKAYGR